MTGRCPICHRQQPVAGGLMAPHQTAGGTAGARQCRGVGMSAPVPIAERLAAMTSEVVPQPITVGELHRFAPDAQGRRRLSFHVAAGNRALAEVAVIPTSSDAPQEHIDRFASALQQLLRGSEDRVADAESRVEGRNATIALQYAEICELKAKLADFEQGRAVRGEFYAIADAQGRVWLAGRPCSAAWGLIFNSWGELARERPGLRPCGTCKSTDNFGPVETYVIMRPIADLETP